MPTTVIYLPDELYEYVKSSDNVSAVVQQALRSGFNVWKKNKEVVDTSTKNARQS